MEQTWPNKELVIVDDADAPSFSGAPAGTVYERVRTRKTVGAKRNLACSIARGELICTWDDDDISAPGRIEDQAVRLLSLGVEMTGYCPVVFVGDGGARLYASPSRIFAPGATIMYRRDFWRAHPFADVQISEETQFIKHARTSIAIVPGGDMMACRTHRGNTSPRDYSVPPYRACGWPAWVQGIA